MGASPKYIRLERIRKARIISDPVPKREWNGGFESPNGVLNRCLVVEIFVVKKSKSDRCVMVDAAGTHPREASVLSASVIVGQFQT